MHPTQVHRIIHFENITICSLSVKDEHLDPGSVKMLEDIIPAEPLALTAENSRTLFQIFELCLYFSAQKNNTLQDPLLKHSCNTLVSFIISQFPEQQKPEAALSRSETITRAFRRLLEKNYHMVKRPGDYAQRLHISTAYLNECVKNATGIPVSQHIRDRIILEAKRRLYHTDQPVKEISFALGFDDYPYFSRLFKNGTGMSALSFRSKNRD